MGVPLTMRFRDWLADHFKFVQYSVPRVRKDRDWARWKWFAVEFIKTAAMFALASVIFLVQMINALTPKRGQSPVALLFLAALLAALSGVMFTFLL